MRLPSSLFVCAAWFGLPLCAALTPGPLRNITFVYDEFRSDINDAEYVNVAGGGGKSYPAHVWIIFQPTSQDTPLRVEIVAPVLNGTVGPLSIKVSDYTTGRDDQGQADWPLPKNISRTTKTYANITTLKNEDLFSTNALTPYDPDIPQSQQPVRTSTVVEQVWYRCKNIADSATFAMRLLQHPAVAIPSETNFFQLSNLQHNSGEGYKELQPFVFKAANWARWKNDQRGTPLTSERVPTFIKYLFYEAIPPRTSPAPGTIRGQRWPALAIPGSPRPVQGLLIWNGDIQYYPTTLPQGWSYFRLDDGRTGAPYLSVDAQLTSTAEPPELEADVNNPWWKFWAPSSKGPSSLSSSRQPSLASGSSSSSGSDVPDDAVCSSVWCCWLRPYTLAENMEHCIPANVAWGAMLGGATIPYPMARGLRRLLRR